MSTTLKLKGELIETPSLETVGKNNTPKTTLKVLENHYKKEGDKWVINDTTLHDLEVWGDKAVEAQALNKGDLLDFSAYETENGLRPRVITKSNEWTYKDKDYKKLIETAFSWEKIERKNGSN